MAHGREDFTYLADTDITAVSIASIAVDIIAQTIAALKINITAQDLAVLKTDIVAQTLAALKINITAQDLAALKMDITAQTLAALKMDITAQTLAALKIDIITQTLASLKINITAQDLASLVIQIGAAQTVSVNTFADWYSTQGAGKALAGSRTNGGVVITYTVTHGKTFYLTEWSCSGTASGVYELIVNSVDVEWAGIAANTPYPHQFKTPIKVAEDIEIYIFVAGTGSFFGNFYGVQI